MGLAKDKLLKMEELGLCDGNAGSVCGDCIGDAALMEFIARNAEDYSCSYCRRQEGQPIACPLEHLVKFMAEIIREEWTDPANELPYETQDGGYLGDLSNAYELLDEIGFRPENDSLFDDIASHFTDQEWCQRDYYTLTPAERRETGWERFCLEVKHTRRYTFWNSMNDGNPEYHPDHLPPGKMMEEIEEVVAGLALICELPLGTQFWRVQDHDQGVVLDVPARFTSPPIESAIQPNRMSPAGIPMFYGAEDFDTAVVEVVGAASVTGRAASGVTFEALRPLQVLDLVFLDQNGSYFAQSGREWRHRSAFLRFFTREVSKPIHSDKRQHVDYVPTQVFTEYVRYQMAAPIGTPVDGIRYLSSKNGRPCYVLFFDQDDCLKPRDTRPQSLQCVPASLKTVVLERSRD